MPDVLPLPRISPVRHGQLLDYDELHREAVKAVEASGRARAEIAEALGVTPPAVTRALKAPGARYAGLQARIIEEVTGYRIEDRSRVEFRVVRKN